MQSGGAMEDASCKTCLHPLCWQGQEGQEEAGKRLCRMPLKQEAKNTPEARTGRKAGLRLNKVSPS